MSMLQAGIIVAVTGGTLALLLTLTAAWQPSRNRVRRRLAGEFGAGEAERTPLYRDLDDLADDLAEAGPAKPKGDFRSRADDLLRQAGMPGTPRQWAVGCAAAGLGFGLTGLLLDGWAVGAVGAAVAAVTPVLVLLTRRRVRREKYLKQLIGAFELMARVLRSGQSVPETFRAAVEAFDDPLSSEFGRCLHQIEHGLRPEEAYRELAQRSGILELRIFVVAMAIQRQTGGNLSEVLDRLAAVVRARLRLRQKIRALTAEGRLQSLTLTVLPVFTFGVMYFLNRQYASELLEHPRLLVSTGVLMAVGVAWIRNVVKFEG